MLDVVYVVRPGETNSELRYSLRSLRNLPHRDVWIVGYKPRWVANVHHIPTEHGRNKWVNTTTNLAAASADAGITDEFVYMNDDFFVLEPMQNVPILHRGPIADVIDRYPGTPGTSYVRGMAAAARVLESWGCAAPLCYELHVPIVLHRDRMADTLDRAAASGEFLHACKRTLYGNLWAVGGEQIDDCKYVTDRPATPGSFASTNEQSFDGRVGKWLRSLFPEPSPYERRGSTHGE